MAVGICLPLAAHAVIGRNVVAEGKTSKRSRSARPCTTVQLPAHLDIAAAGELKQTLSASLLTAGELVLDAAAVEHADCAGMQLLFAFRHAADQQGHKLRWANPSARLKAAAALLGMTDAFGFDI
jgi:anti-anti-sigma factor